MSSNSDFGLAGVEAASLDRVPNLFLLDTSYSMTGETTDIEGEEKAKIKQVNDGLEIFTEEISDDNKAEISIDVSIVTFGDDVTVEQEFQPINDAWIDGDGPPELNAVGTTPMNQAIVEGLQHLEEYKDAVDDQNLPRKRALVWLLTDGEPDYGPGSQEWDKAQSLIEKGTDEDRLFFYAVGIGDDADIGTLEELVSPADESDVAAFQLEENMFKEFFRIASKSATGSVTGEGETAEDTLEEDTEAMAQQDLSDN
ncbi:vWA domain-containing protein [Halosimplex pelagicum]|uniref:VWA domain-containing protein n=1 Tax=Halosimplex pelagicum TaxID=869886 RepID=A0A7D5T715_9EURY|nr:VWA domain-containing protein [Halosimplex pelagicum]QLH83768.1 VWA domain-containing protein [Halosimplex pelagicum]